MRNIAKHRPFKFYSILLVLSGVVLKFLADRRNDSLFDGDGIKLGFDPEYQGWFWGHCGQLGFAMIALGVILYLVDHGKEARKLLVLAALISLSARGSDINAGYSWTPTDRVTAAKLNSQITGASINTTFATDKSSAQPVGGDSVAFYQSSAGTWRKTSLNVLLLQNTNLIVTQTEDLDPATNDFILTWDVSANTLARVTLGTVITNTARFVATNGLFTYQGPLVGVESSNSVNVAHGLGVTPGFVRCVLVCTNADRNYAAGDEVDAAGVTDNDGFAGLGISVNSTRVIVQEGNINLRVFDHVPGHTPQAIIYAKWNIKVYLRP